MRKDEISIWLRGSRYEQTLPKHNRSEQREYDKSLYKNRNLVERFFSTIEDLLRDMKN